MCGITGLYSFDPRGDRAKMGRCVRNMTDAIQSRGPDDSGVWNDPERPLFWGHRRLSILDLTDAERQPMGSVCGRYVIVFNGEIYNFKQIREQLVREHRAVFHGDGDTEVLLTAISHEGIEKAVELSYGMFAFALWDKKLGILHLVRDRMGKKPLYVGWAGSTLVFGSELKAICAHPDFRRDVNRNALTSYMRFGYVPAPLCIYDQVLQLLPGSMMSIDVSLMHAGQDLKNLMKPYWSAKDVLQESRSNMLEASEARINEFEQLLEQCVSERMISDVPLGSFLSGGIDSSTIVALMQKLSAEKIKTYTIGFDVEGYNEAQHAKEIATHLGTDHYEMIVKGKDVIDLVPQMPYFYDEPFADASALPTYLLSKFARQSVTVALSGDGGDEMLGGYNRHIKGPSAWETVGNLPKPFRKPIQSIIRTVPVNVWNKLRKDRPQFGSHMYKFADILDKEYEGDVYMQFVTHWSKPKLFVVDGQEEVIPLVDPVMQAQGLDFAESMMYWDTLTYLNGDILTKVDRASMAVGLEVRAPLLDARVLSYVWRLPFEMKIKKGKGKWLLRQLLKRHVPEHYFERPKQGFTPPIGDWMRGDLKGWAEDLLQEDNLRAQGLLDYVSVSKLWQEHQQGKGDHAQKLWTVLMFQAWHRHWVDRK
ncbi:MAG: asparagine synthase (glutamine-hydrolyzing) [Alphaproteobacteria bacterium]|nr:asparagine synthase (glutamine-hydrolyzing) [Alphaproteobacteria bacterium]